MTIPYTVKCNFCNTVKTFQLEFTKLGRWKNGELIQDLFPELSIDDRELMISRTCGKCFDKMFPKEE